MFSISQFYNPWRSIWSKIRNKTLRYPWCWWSCNCHSGPDVVIHPHKQTESTAKKQLNKRAKRERSSCQAVLEQFDQQYNQELGELWTSARAVLLDPQSWQYGIMLNRFAAVTDITQILQSQGFSKILLQTDASSLLCDAPLLKQHPSKQPEENVSPLLSNYPPDNSHLQLDRNSDTVKQCLQSESSLSQHSPLLQCYIHPYPLRFPSQAHRPGHLKQYYLLNAASLLPVLAMQVKDGENILDLCSAPGGKAIAIMQSCTPARLCCNEPDPHRRDWLAKTLESFLPHSLKSRVIVSAQDGRCFGQSETSTYDKVLVDAPCSNDRSWLYSTSGQQVEQRLRERARLPALQAQLLKSALSALRPGGVAVYSTCTLSSSENYTVIETVLKDCPEAEPEDLWEEIVVPFSKYFTFSRGPCSHGQTAHTQFDTVSSYHHRLGILVVPHPGKTWGPMFLSRIRRRI